MVLLFGILHLCVGATSSLAEDAGRVPHFPFVRCFCPVVGFRRVQAVVQHVLRNRVDITHSIQITTLARRRLEREREKQNDSSADGDIRLRPLMSGPPISLKCGQHQEQLYILWRIPS